MAEAAVAEEMTPEEVKAYRAEVIADMEAEESGKPIVDATTAEEQEAELEAEKDPEPVKDPWAGIPDEIKNQLTTTATRLKQAESRIGALTNELHNAKKAAEEAEKAPTEEQIAAAAKSDEDWAELKEDFPEWANAIQGQFDKIRGEITGITKEDLAAEAEKIKADLKGETEATIEKAILTYAHPNWEATIAGKDYAEWLKTQPEDVITKTQSSRAVDAIDVLDRFVGLKGKAKTATEIAEARSKRIKTSTVPEGKKVNTPKAEADMTDAELRTKVGREVWADD